MKHLSLTLALFVALCTPAWAVNKCTGADGKVAFQDAPCNGKGEQLTVHPASGDASISTNSAASSQPDWQRKAAQVDARLAIYAAIGRHEAVIGMTPDQLEQAMGLPNRINTGDYKSGSTQQRIYGRGQTTWYVYTDGALVTAVQTSIAPGSRSTPKLCPSGVEIRAAETSASSITLSEAEKVERFKQIREMRNCGK